MPITLYYFPPGAPSRSVLMTARTLNLDVVIKEIDLFNKRANLPPEFVTNKPQHCIPTIDDDGYILWESRAVNTYLVKTYGTNSGLYPQDNAELTAIVDRFLYFDADSLYPAIRKIGVRVMFRGETKVPKYKKDKINEVLGYLNMFLDGVEWIAKGANYTIADISLVATVSSIVAIEWDLSSFPNVKRWYDKCAATIPGFDENIEGAKIFGDDIKSKLEAGEI